MLLSPARIAMSGSFSSHPIRVFESSLSGRVTVSRGLSMITDAAACSGSAHDPHGEGSLGKLAAEARLRRRRGVRAAQRKPHSAVGWSEVCLNHKCFLSVGPLSSPTRPSPRVLLHNGPREPGADHDRSARSPWR